MTTKHGYKIYLITMQQSLSCIIDCVKYLAQEMMALRGHDSVGGKLLNLFRLLAKYHPTAAIGVNFYKAARLEPPPHEV